ncbi:hypothetical protein MPER_00419, partial [Moniliophthora perniciosa FA553]
MVLGSFAFVVLGASLALARPTAPNPASGTCSFTESPESAHPSVNHTTSLSRRQTTWNPPSNLVTPLNEVWEHEMSTYGNPLGFMNYGFDQVIANNGKVNYCVRWESSGTVTTADRENVEMALRRSINKWNDWLKDFDGWPYQTLDVNVVGWAVSDRNKLQGDVSGIQVYT